MLDVSHQLSTASQVRPAASSAVRAPVVSGWPLRRRYDLHRQSCPHASRKEFRRPMSTHTLPVEAPLTPKQAVLADEIGNEVYASHYAERKAYRLIIGCGTVLLLGSMGSTYPLRVAPLRTATSGSTRWVAPRRSSTAILTTVRARVRCGRTSLIGRTIATPSAATPSPRSIR